MVGNAPAGIELEAEVDAAPFEDPAADPQLLAHRDVDVRQEVVLAEDEETGARLPLEQLAVLIPDIAKGGVGLDLTEETPLRIEIAAEHGAAGAEADLRHEPHVGAEVLTVVLEGRPPAPGGRGVELFEETGVRTELPAVPGGGEFGLEAGL